MDTTTMIWVLPMRRVIAHAVAALIVVVATACGPDIDGSPIGPILV